MRRFSGGNLTRNESPGSKDSWRLPSRCLAEIRYRENHCGTSIGTGARAGVLSGRIPLRGSNRSIWSLQLWTDPSLLEKARGILFIDGSLSSLGKGQRCGLWDRAINTILKFMEDPIVTTYMIIFAGFIPKMEEVLKDQSGLRSRVPIISSLRDFTGDEIVQQWNDPQQGLQTRRPGLLCAAC